MRPSSAECCESQTRGPSALSISAVDELINRSFAVAARAPPEETLKNKLMVISDPLSVFSFPVSSRGGNISVETMLEPDNSLLAEFNARRSEQAFAALVRQHVHLVLATAIRQVGDAGAAEEITQIVFVALAQAAGNGRVRPQFAGRLRQRN